MATRLATAPKVQRPASRRPGTGFPSTALTTAPDGKILLTCEICKKQYEDTTQFGLHVCPKCSDPTRTVGPKVKKGPPERPKMLVCYVCGREFGHLSLPIHQAQCLKKRAIEQAKLPPEMRTTLHPPTGDIVARPAGASDEEYNALAYESYKQNLVPCPNCGRTFSSPDRLEVHLRSCKPGSSSKPITAVHATTHQKLVHSSPDQKASTRPASRIPQPQATVQASHGASGTGAMTLRHSAGSEDASGGRPGSSSSRLRTPSSRELDSSLREPASASYDAAPPGGGGGGMALDDVPVGGGAPPPEETYDGGDQQMAPCSICGRMFNADRLAKHESICAKQKTHKVFDASKRRVDGEAAAAAKSSPQPKAKAASSAASQAKWRAEHDAFMSTIKNARKMSTMTPEEIAAMPPPPPEEHPDYVQCPHCLRKFNQKAAERHIPACANMRNRPAPPPSLKAGGAPPSRGPAQPLSHTRLSATSGGAGAGAGRPGSSGTSGLSRTIGGTASGPRPAANKGALPMSATGKDFCGNCGRRLTGQDVRFCSGCGKRL